MLNPHFILLSPIICYLILLLFSSLHFQCLLLILNYYYNTKTISIIILMLVTRKVFSNLWSPIYLHSKLFSDSASVAQISKIGDIANQLRIDSIRAIHITKTGHPTSCASIAQIISVLFFSEFGLKFNSNNVNNFLNDRLILSKGHAAPILYSALYRSKVIKQSQLLSLRLKQSTFEGHPTPKVPFVDVATGSLGQGLSVAAGMAYSSKFFDKISNKIYCIVGDGEMAEGNIWEAIDFSSHYKLNNLVMIVDMNRLGQSQETLYGHNTSILNHRLSVFGWNCQVVNGHSVQEIVGALKTAQSESQKPNAIICKTLKGKNLGAGIQNASDWHGKDLGDKLKETIENLQLSIQNKNIQFKTFAPTQSFYLHHQNKQIKIQPNYRQGDKISTRKAYGFGLRKARQSNQNVVALDGDTKNSTFSSFLQNKFPESFIQCFIAEQNMVGVATGLTCRNKIPFCSTFGAFFTRAADQIRIAGIGRNPIKIVGSHAGCSIGEDGPSQMALEDLGFYRNIPNSIVLIPSDGVSTEKAVQIVANYNKGPSYIRTSRPQVPILYKNNENFEIGKCKVIRRSQNDSALIISYGVTLHEAVKAYEKLQKQGINIRIIDLFCIKPLDVETILLNIQQCKGKVVVVQQHYPAGAACEAICTVACSQIKAIKHLCVQNIPGSAKPYEQLQLQGLDSKSINFTFLSQSISKEDLKFAKSEKLFTSNVNLWKNQQQLFNNQSLWETLIQCQQYQLSQLKKGKTTLQLCIRRGHMDYNGSDYYDQFIKKTTAQMKLIHWEIQNLFEAEFKYDDFKKVRFNLRRQTCQNSEWIIFKQHSVVRELESAIHKDQYQSLWKFSKQNGIGKTNIAVFICTSHGQLKTNEKNLKFMIQFLKQVFQRYQAIKNCIHKSKPKCDDNSHLFFDENSIQIDEGNQFIKIPFIKKAAKYLMSPMCIEEIQITSKGIVGSQWRRDKKNGGLQFINQKKIAAQKGIIKSIFSQIGKNFISGKSILSISLPVQIFSTDSHLERLLHCFRLAPFIFQSLAKISKQNISAYILQDALSLSAVFGITNSLLYLSQEKSFNPILGETSQLWISGCPAYGQQISHHPPVSSLYFVGRGYTIYGQLQAKVDLGLNSGKGCNDGEITIQFDNGLKIRNLFAPGEVSGLAYGSRKFRITGKSFHFIEDSGLFLQIDFSNKKQTQPDKISAKLFEIPKEDIRQFCLRRKFKSQKGHKLIGNNNNLISGFWSSQMRVDSKLLLDIQQVELGSLYRQKHPLSSDCIFREDIFYRKKQNFEMAQKYKNLLEQRQRNDKNLRKKYL